MIGLRFSQRTRPPGWPARIVCILSLLSLAPPRAAGMGGEALFRSKGCAACHGEDGSHPVIPDYPVIAGQNAPYLLRQMRDIRDGRRANGLSQNMREAVGDVTDEEFRAIATWLSNRW